MWQGNESWGWGGDDEMWGFVFGLRVAYIGCCTGMGRSGFVDLV